MAIANALQLEAVRAMPALSRFNYDAMPSFWCWYVMSLIGGKPLLPSGSQEYVDPTSTHFTSYQRQSGAMSQCGLLCRAIIPTQEDCFRFQISWCMIKRRRLKIEWRFKRRQISHLPPPVKFRRVWARSLYQLLKLYLWSNLWNTCDGHPLRGCWARWIDKKKNNVRG